MASSRRPQTMGANDAGVLPLDVIYEIMLRVPARLLCRLRSVCQSWRSLLSDPSFAATHAARHRCDPPLFAVCVAGGTHGKVAEINLLDTSGHAVKRVNAGPSSPLREMLPHLDLVLLRGTVVGVQHQQLRVLDPATGSVSLLPDDGYGAYYKSFVFGRAAAPSTAEDGEYKVLSLCCCPHYIYVKELCKVLTVDGSGGGSGRWRTAPRPPVNNITSFHKGTVVARGVVYHPVYQGDRWKIARFDLAAEQWWSSLLEGPVTVPFIGGRSSGSLAEVNGQLAVVSYHTVSTMDIWMLMGSGEQAMWCKQCRVGMPSIQRYHGLYAEVKPLSMLDDGRVPLWVFSSYNSTGALWIYDPRTETCTHVVTMEKCLKVGVGVYTGNLLRELQPAHGMKKL